MKQPSTLLCRHDNVSYLEKLKGLTLRLERTLEEKVRTHNFVGTSKPQLISDVEEGLDACRLDENVDREKQKLKDGTP
jgi:hypothetical protein